MKITCFLFAITSALLLTACGTTTSAGAVFGEPVPVTAHADHTFLLDSADRFLAPDYIQHNPTAPTGREAFKEIFSSFVPRQDTVPDTITNPVVTIIAEGDLVVMACVNEYDEPDPVKR